MASGRFKASGVSGVHVFHGMNTRDALRAAAELGCSTEMIGGEWIVMHPLIDRRVRTSNIGKRKDASRDLTGFLLNVQKLLAEDEEVDVAGHDERETNLEALGIYVQAKKKKRVIETTTTSVVVGANALARLCGITPDDDATYEMIDTTGKPVSFPITLRVLQIEEREEEA